MIFSTYIILYFCAFYRGKPAVDLFHRMGIRTVGHLASISTLTAKSIPAGDNRLHRLRKALKVRLEYGRILIVMRILKKKQKTKFIFFYAFQEYDDCRTSFYESKGNSFKFE